MNFPDRYDTIILPNQLDNVKKLMAIILTVAMCLSLCACGKSDACTCDCQQCALCEQKAHSHETADKGADENNISFSNPVCLVDSEEVRIDLVGFNQKDSVIKDVTITKKYIALKIHNKASYEIMLKLENLAVRDEQVKCIYLESSTQYPRILAGDTTTYYIEIKPAFEDALNSMEDLYHLKGRVQIGQHIIYQGYDGFGNASDHYFSVPDAMSNS